MKESRILALVLISVAALSGLAAAEDPGLRPLQEAFSAGRLDIQRMSEEREAQATAAETLFHPQALEGLPQPDAKTTAWLASRIPNLDAKTLKAVPLEIADTAMQRAVAAKATYLDLFTNDAFRGADSYYVSQDILNALHKKYISGSLPVQGNDENGKPFQMQGLVIGANRVNILFDRENFVFKDAKNKFKIQNKGRVESTVKGPGDVGIDGLWAYGAPIVCPWAKVNRMTKESMYKIKVETSCGSRGGNDIHEIRVR